VAHVLCVGIATLDQIFRVAEMPSRAEKYRAHDLAVTGGGTAANGAVAVARLGGRSSMLTVLGDDPVGDAIVAGLAQEGIDTAGIRREAGHRSPLSAILVDARGERMIVSYSDRALPGDPGWLPQDLAGADAVLGDTRWQAGSARLFRAARSAGIPAILDGDRAPTEDPDLMDLATHVALSEQGLRDLTGRDDPRAGLAALGPSRTGWLGVTAGADGVFFFENGAVVHLPAFPVTVVDTLGAGDTWHGAFALALAEGRGERDAIGFASAAAAIKCTRFGGRDGAPTRAEVDSFLRMPAPN
jgi:sulfofructose kinase